MKRLLEEGEAALARTPELMAVLKEAGVVDAGGKGFVRMLEGVVRYIHGDPDPDGVQRSDELGGTHPGRRRRHGRSRRARLSVLHRGPGAG